MAENLLPHRGDALRRAIVSVAGDKSGAALQASLGREPLGFKRRKRHKLLLPGVSVQINAPYTLELRYQVFIQRRYRRAVLRKYDAIDVSEATLQTCSGIQLSLRKTLKTFCWFLLVGSVSKAHYKDTGSIG
jgi:hypothetical protein